MKFLNQSAMTKLPKTGACCSIKLRDEDGDLVDVCKLSRKNRPAVACAFPGCKRLAEISCSKRYGTYKYIGRRLNLTISRCRSTHDMAISCLVRV
jgi:hypothetical protein